MPRQFGVPESVINDVVNGRSSPSVYSPYMSAIHHRHVIAVNVAYMIGDWIDMVVFGDNKFYLAHRKGLSTFRGLKVSCNPKHIAESYHREGVKFLLRDMKHRRGISSNPRMVSWNSNSGAAAINVAVHTGVKRIVLLGFDMRLSESGAQHWHSLYCRDRKKEVKSKRIHLPFDKHLIGFPEIAKDAKRLGVEILNASPDSAIECLMKCTVKQILSDGDKSEQTVFLADQTDTE